MNRLKLFVENFVVYGLGGAISRVVPLIMLPIITRLMPKSFYMGLNDISTVIVSFGSAIALMGFYDAMYRMFFEKDDLEYKQEICSTALMFTIGMSIIVFLVLIIFKEAFSVLFFSDEKYANLLLLTAMSILIGSTNSIIAAPTRMENKRGTYIFFNTLSPIVSYSISIPLLLNGYYVIALPLAAVISALVIELSFYFLNKKWFSFNKIRLSHLKDLLNIGVPLVPNFLVYWIFSSSDKLMIAKLLGTSFTGVYAVGGKIGQISQLIYTAFAGGWQYFSFSTMNDDDQVEMTSNIFEYLGTIAFVAGMFLCCFNDLIFKILFTGDYLNASVVAPYLFMSPLIQMLYQIACNQFLIIKKTWPTILILSIGAISNVIINYFGIKYIGIEGAAIATLTGYVISTIISVIVLTRMKLLSINKRFIIVIVLFTLFFMFYKFLNLGMLLLFIIMCFICMIYLYLYKKDIRLVIKK